VPPRTLSTRLRSRAAHGTYVERGMTRDVSPQDELVGQSTDGEGCSQSALHSQPQLFAELLAQHRQRLRALVELRMDRRLQGRIDPSDYFKAFSAER